MRIAATDECHHCKQRYALSRHSNRHKHSGSPIKGRFCSSKCRQAAYRKRNEIAPQARSGTDGPRCVTTSSAPEIHSEKINEINAPEAGLVAPEKDGSVPLRRVRGVELFSRFAWEDRISSGGVPIRVSRLGRSSLVRTP
jgi:hypothetical protein